MRKEDHNMGRPFDRQKAILDQWKQTQELARDIINAGLEDTGTVKLSILRELVAMLSLAMRYLNTINLLQISNPDKKYFVPRRRREIISLWDGLLQLTKAFTAEVRKNPLEATGSTLSTLTNISRRSFDMLAVLMDAEEAQKQDKARAKGGGMSAEEAAMIKEFEALNLEVDEKDLTSFDIGNMARSPGKVIHK
jgi:hypothetical protein